MAVLCSSCFAQLRREANTTIRLPVEPVSANGDIILTEAFPGLEFHTPVCIRAVPGETNALIVVERFGRVMIITNLAEPKAEVFLDISDRVYASDWIYDRRTEGLSSIAFHPDFRQNGRFFVSYCMKPLIEEGQTNFYNRLSEFRASDDRWQGLRDSEIPYITQLDEGEGHNINDLHFGPDQFLYVAIGDEGDGNTGGDEYNNAQKIDKDFFSAIMRIDVDHRPGSLPPNPHPANTTNYWVPGDNPFVGVTNFLGKAVRTNQVRTEFWAVGLRNPWRISFDPLTGVLYEGDVGQHGREEINRIVKGGNYGWSFFEGYLKGPKAPGPTNYTFNGPIAEYGAGNDQSQGYSVTAGVVYRGFKIPSLYGSLIYADYVSGNIWALNVDQNPVEKPVWLLNKKGIASFGNDPRNGAILAVYHNETEPGKIYRIEASGGSNENYPASLADTGIFSDLETLTPAAGVVPYDVNLPFWSDGAIKSRWFSIPDRTNQITFSPESNWRFPTGTIWVKHFDLPTAPGETKRIETRVLVKSTIGAGVYGLTYQWDDSGTNATLVSEAGENKTFLFVDGTNVTEQVWRYPGRAECLACHTTVGGLALGFNTAQLNKSHPYGALSTNQLLALAAAGYFENPPGNLLALRALARTDDATVSRTVRVRSYLAANCSFCHQPGGGALSRWDARAVTPLSFAHIVNGPLNNSLGDTSNRVVVAGSPAHSAMLRRISSSTQRMPPVGSTVLDQEAIDLLTAWIQQDLPTADIYATWAERMFPGAGGDKAEDADPDGDGLTNYREYLARTDPLSAASRFQFSPSLTKGRIAFSLTQPTNRAMLIESTYSLSDPYWTFLNTPENIITFPLDGQVRTISEEMNGIHKFWRIRLIEP